MSTVNKEGKWKIQRKRGRKEETWRQLPALGLLQDCLEQHGWWEGSNRLQTQNQNINSAKRLLSELIKVHNVIKGWKENTRRKNKKGRVRKSGKKITVGEEDTDETVAGSASLSYYWSRPIAKGPRGRDGTAGERPKMSKRFTGFRNPTDHPWILTRISEPGTLQGS